MGAAGLAEAAAHAALGRYGRHLEAAGARRLNRAEVAALEAGFAGAALAGVGLSTDFRSFRGLGIKPFFVGLGAALAVGVVSMIAISLLGDLVTF